MRQLGGAVDDALACSGPLDHFPRITVEKAGRTVGTVDEHYISPLRKDLVKLTKHAQRQGLPIGDVQLRSWMRGER